MILIKWQIFQMEGMEKGIGEPTNADVSRRWNSIRKYDDRQ